MYWLAVKTLMTISIGSDPHRPKTLANMTTIIQSAINGDDVPPVLIISVAAVVASSQYITSVTGKIIFFGIHKYETKQIKAVMLAKKKAGISTTSDLPMF